MADLPRDPDTADGTDVRRGAGSAPGTPRWVKVSVITAIVVAVLVILMLSGLLGQHGPGRHVHSGGLGAPRSSSHVLTQDHALSSGDLVSGHTPPGVQG